jgi:hypothetical protein
VNVVYSVGSKVPIHSKANVDPLFSHCVICGKVMRKMGHTVSLNFDGLIDSTVSAENGWRFAVGSECAKQFDQLALKPLVG